MTVTVSNITAVDYGSNDNIILSLLNRVIPATGSYGFSAKADTDGSVTEKAFSSGTANETSTLITSNGPVDDFICTAEDKKIQFTFSPSNDASSVVLEMKTKDTDYFYPVPGLELAPESTTAVVSGLNNGDIYYFRLTVTGGNHNGSTNAVLTSPTRVDPDNTTVTIDNSLAVNTGESFTYTSTITLTLIDSFGDPISNSYESFYLLIPDPNYVCNKSIIINNDAEPIIDPSLTETFYYLIYGVDTDTQGKITIRISLKVPDGVFYNPYVSIYDSNNNFLASFY
jgi:hypothetical protein